MLLTFTDSAWDDYLYWQKTDKKILKKINDLIKDIKRHPYEGLGKPEPLRHDYAGYWSRRIDKENRLVYFVNKESISIIKCRYHY